MKLKIKKAVNESNIKTNMLTEADVNRGYRIKAIEKLSDKVSAAVTKAGYKYKPVSQTGFYIMPYYGYLGELKITGTDAEESTFDVQINNIYGRDLAVNGKTINKLTYNELIETADDIGLALAKTLIAPANFENMSENLIEDTILEYGPWSAIKGFFNKAATKVTDFFAEKAADKAEKKGTKAILQGINETLSEALNNAIKSLLKDGKQYVTVKSTIDGNTLTLELKCDFVTAITFDADPKDARKIIVSKLLTPLGEVNVKLKTLPQVLAMISKVLDITFNFEDIYPESENTKTTNDSKETADGENASNSQDYWRYVIGDDAFNELGVVEEDLKDTITETYKMKIPAANYKKAFDKIKDDDDAAYALIRYFLLNETNGALSEEDAKKLDLKTIDDITDIIKSKNTFNPNAEFSLLYILNYIRKHKKVNNVAISLAKELPKCCQNRSILEHLKSIIYSKILFNSAKDIETLQDLIEAWYGVYPFQGFKKDVLSKLSKKSRQNLANKFEIKKEFADVPESDTSIMKRYLFLDPATTGDSQKFRSLSELEAINKAIIAAYNSSTESKSTKTDSSSSSSAKTSRTAIDNPSDIIDRITNTDNFADTIDAPTLQELLTALGKTKISSQENRSALASTIGKILGKIHS